MNNKHYVGRRAKSITIGTKLPPVSGVVLSGSNDAVFVAGDETGYVVETFVPNATQQMANDLLNKMRGFEYQGYTAQGAFIPPDVELGDGITIKGIYGVLAGREYSFTPKMSETISAPYETEDKHEYGYKGNYAQDIAHKVQQGWLYYGTRISKKNGLEIVKTDGSVEKSRVTLNSDTLAFYNNDGQEAFYYDAPSGVFRLTQYANVEDALDGSQAFSSLELTAKQFQIQISTIEGNYSRLSQTVNSIDAEISTIEGNYSRLSQTVNSIDAEISTIEGNYSRLSQTVNSISLNVTGSLGGTASIKLSSDAGTSTGLLDLTDVRGAFADDHSSVSISAGVITFNSNTFAVNSNNLTIDQYGDLTAEGAMITAEVLKSISNEYSDRYIRMANGRIRFYDSYNIGNIGEQVWSQSPYATGISFELREEGTYLSWSARENDLYHAKLLYTNQSLAWRDITYVPDTLYFECDAMSRNMLSFGYDPSDVAGYIWYSVNSNNKPTGLTIRSYGTLKLHANDGVVDVSSNLNIRNNDILMTSDERLKTNIQNSDISALDVLNTFKLFEFDWIQTNIHEPLGFVAQQLIESGGSHFVDIDPQTGQYSIRNLKLIPYIVKAIQELSSIILGDSSLYCSELPDTWSPETMSLEDKYKFIKACDEQYGTYKKTYGPILKGDNNE